MIIGVGTDLVCIKHFKSAFKKTPAILDRVFTPAEKEHADKLTAVKKMAYYAKRFAAKEAISKACGTGIGRQIGWQDMEILNDKSGAPVASFSSKSQLFLQKKFKTKKIQILISLADEDEYALAFATLTK